MDIASEQALSRKERRELRRQEQHQEQTRQVRRRSLRRGILWLSVLAVLALVGWLVWQAAQNSAVSGVAGELAVPVGAEDHVRGPADAPVTLVEYVDFQCPACASFHPIVNDLLERTDGQIRLVSRHFPLRSIHANAQLTSQAAEAAGLQGSFWEMQDLLFSRQSEWASLSRAAVRERMITYAQELGLDVQQFETDLESDAVEHKIEADIASGNASGVSSTPSFFVNGTYISGFQTLEEFENMVLGAADAVTE